MKPGRRLVWLASMVGVLGTLPAGTPAEQPAPQAKTPPAAQPAGATPAPAQTAPAVSALTDTGWPRTITSGATRIVVYQPQIDSWDGFRVVARAAVAVTEQADAPPVYGIVHVSADTHVDKDAREVSLEKFTVKSAAFPGASAKAQPWVNLIQARAERLKPMALERFEAAVAVSAAERKGESVAVKNDAPIIRVSTVPAMLILVDGDPVYRDVKATALTRVLNTRPLILKDASGRHYLKIFDGWMEAPALAGPWTVATTLPGDCEKALKVVVDEKVADMLLGGDPNDPKTAPSLKKQVPHILIETKPAELLVFEGDPKFVPIEGTKLMYAENTTGHLFIDAADQQAYILVSGRWFRGPSKLTGPWAFVAGDQLPKDFAQIPDDSAKENVKASVPGTEQAEEAVIANSLPQTAQVKRSAATFTSQYDGEPKLAPIESTTMQYVANASAPIIVVGNPPEYFGVQNGVWFVANSLGGPWLVATAVPAEIYSIPASSPLHYVTYVRVYDSTPTEVIVGYTPGYTGAYVSGGCVVYGTGYYYPPWIGSYWYGPPYTYGFGVGLAYTPWAGWHVGFGFGWTWGATVAVGWGWGAYPWWGGYGWGGYYPWAYYGGGVAWGARGGMAAWGPGYWGGTTGNMYHRWGSTTAVTRRGGGYNAWTGNRWATQAGRSYNSRTGVAAAGQRGVVGNVYSGNYAAGGRGGAVNTNTGAAVAGRGGTIGTAGGREISGGQAAIRGPGGNTTTIGGIKGDQGGVMRAGDDVYAGHDGNVYKHKDGGGWDQVTRPEPRDRPQVDRSQIDRNLDRERAGRSNGNYRSGAARSGGFHGGGGGRGGGGRGGGGRRR